MPSSGSSFALGLAGAAAMALPAVPAAAAQAAGAQSCHGSEGYAASFGGRRTFLWQPAMLAAAKSRLDADPAAMAALRKRADAALEAGPFSVTDKRQAGPSGDLHDYRSLAPYWWPTPGNRGGTPYSRRDGKINPERDGTDYDLRRLEDFTGTATLLALAYHHTGDSRYADRSAALIRTWFVDPNTRMNPNLNFAQAVPGRESGRAEGVIDASRLVSLVESVGLLQPSGALTPADQDVLQEWFGDLVQWMATSPNGRAERAKANNHGIYYDMLISQFALFAGLDPVTEAVTKMFGERRIAPQVAADGSLPEELERTRSWHYTLWTLVAGARVAQLGNCVGVDVTAYRDDEGASLGTALGYAAGFTDPQTEWTHKDLAFRNPDKMRDEDRLAYETFASAAYYLGESAYSEAARHYRRAAEGGDVILIFGAMEGI